MLTILDRGEEIAMTPEVYEEIHQFVEQTIGRYVRELKIEGLPEIEPDELLILKKALFESEAELYPTLYVMRSNSFQRKLVKLRTK